MPYITQDRREKLTPYVTTLMSQIVVTKAEGELAFVFTLLLDERFGEGDFSNRIKALAVLESVKQEWYRRILVPYEENKKATNGDVFYDPRTAHADDYAQQN